MDMMEASAERQCSTLSRKEQPSAIHLRLNSARSRGKSGKAGASHPQDSGSPSERAERSIWDIAHNGPKQSHQKHEMLRWTWSRVKQDVRTTARTVRRYPLVALVPFLAWLLMMAGSIYVVVGTASRESSHRRSLATQIANDKALFLETELAKVFMPAYVCSVYVRRDPMWAAVNASFEPMALEMIRLSHAGSILTLSLIPNGVIYTMVPLNGTSPADDPNWRAIGKDWLQDRFNMDKVLQAIDTKRLTIIGPYNLIQGGIGMVAMLSIRVAGAQPNETFGVPPYVHGALGDWQTPPRVQYGPNLTDTPYAPYMYDNSTSSKWWGLTTVLISWDTLRDKVMRLDDLEALEYRYVLSRPALKKELLEKRPDLANGTHELAVAWSHDIQEVDLNATNNGVRPSVPGNARPLIYYDLHTRLREAVSARVSVEGDEMTLYVEPRGGWDPSWRDPILGVVVVVSLVLSFMLFIILLNRRQHLGLLQAMIPKKVINTLRRGEIFTESFDCVTILFSDIVSYTTMSAQMEPIQVVKMLDELYKEYDNLTEKHSLYKVETIGDAFMVVGGAPDALEASEAASRVTQMALDMVELTRTRVLSGGHVIRIRVGIHSGPIVAAVVGRKMPRYCLFGDTVNTASRMESNGSPMRIHVSAATAELLREAGRFMLEPRGDIPIKGKGSMSTFWVTSTCTGRTQTGDTSLQVPSLALTQPPQQSPSQAASDASRQTLPGTLPPSLACVVPIPLPRSMPIRPLSSLTLRRELEGAFDGGRNRSLDYGDAFTPADRSPLSTLYHTQSIGTADASTHRETQRAGEEAGGNDAVALAD